MIKLKVKDHYEHLSVWTLYWDWHYEKLKTYDFSKSQLARIQKAFEEHQNTLEALKHVNLDTYTEADFEATEPEEFDDPHIL